MKNKFIESLNKLCKSHTLICKKDLYLKEKSFGKRVQTFSKGKMYQILNFEPIPFEDSLNFHIWTIDDTNKQHVLPIESLKHFIIK